MISPSPQGLITLHACDGHLGPVTAIADKAAQERDHLGLDSSFPANELLSLAEFPRQPVSSFVRWKAWHS